MKLYVIVRADLPAGMQLAQSCHALRLFTAEHPDVDQEWYEESNNLVCLQIPDEPDLTALCERAERAGVPCSRFHEPDLGDHLTAIALAPGGHRLVSSLPLALRE